MTATDTFPLSPLSVDVAHAARPHMVSYIADLIRRDCLDGPDVETIACAVDWEADQEWVGRAGTDLHAYLLLVQFLLNETAADLVQSAMEALGW